MWYMDMEDSSTYYSNSQSFPSLDISPPLLQDTTSTITFPSSPYPFSLSQYPKGALLHFNFDLNDAVDPTIINPDDFRTDHLIAHSTISQSGIILLPGSITVSPRLNTKARYWGPAWWKEERTPSSDPSSDPAPVFPPLWSSPIGAGCYSGTCVAGRLNTPLMMFQPLKLLSSATYHYDNSGHFPRLLQHYETYSLELLLPPPLPEPGHSLVFDGMRLFIGVALLVLLAFLTFKYTRVWAKLKTCFVSCSNVGRLHEIDEVDEEESDDDYDAPHPVAFTPHDDNFDEDDSDEDDDEDNEQEPYPASSFPDARPTNGCV
jgi:hypothetical protein